MYRHLNSRPRFLHELVSVSLLNVKLVRNAFGNDKIVGRTRDSGPGYKTRSEKRGLRFWKSGQFRAWLAITEQRWCWPTHLRKVTETLSRGVSTSYVSGERANIIFQKMMKKKWFTPAVFRLLAQGETLPTPMSQQRVAQVPSQNGPRRIIIQTEYRRYAKQDYRWMRHNHGRATISSFRLPQRYVHCMRAVHYTKLRNRRSSALPRNLGNQYIRHTCEWSRSLETGNQHEYPWSGRQSSTLRRPHHHRDQLSTRKHIEKERRTENGIENQQHQSHCDLPYDLTYQRHDAMVKLNTPHTYLMNKYANDRKTKQWFAVLQS